MPRSPVLPDGPRKITPGFNCKANKIIHAVGPQSGDSPNLLASCYRRALDLAKAEHQRSIAFPCISTGIFAYDSKVAADIAMSTVKEWLDVAKNRDAMDSTIFEHPATESSDQDSDHHLPRHSLHPTGPSERLRSWRRSGRRGPRVGHL